MGRHLGDDSVRLGDRARVFFRSRENLLSGAGSGIVSEEDVAVAMLYGEQKDALQRSHDEMALVGPQLGVDSNSAVIDLGCGAGRWADYLRDRAGAYVGIDPNKNLIRAARHRIPDSNCTFLHTTLRPVSRIAHGGLFDVAILAGVIHYLDDEELLSLLHDVVDLTGKGRVYVRGPFSRYKRLTLIDEWSEVLETEYSAIYRTREEFQSLIPEAFTPVSEGNPFPNHKSRRDTFQHYWIFNVD